MSVEEGEDLYHVRKITKVHFRIFRATILPPFDTLFSNEYNFFSIGCLLRLKKYVIPLLILFGMKKILMSTLSIFQKFLIILAYTQIFQNKARG